MSEQLALLPRLLTAHLQLALSALLVGSLLSVPLGVLVRRRAGLEAVVLGVAAVIQTVPGLALLAVMVPLLAGLGLPGIGFLPAFLGLVLYSALPILRNTVAGLAGIDAAVLEAARGLGMTRAQRLWQVELPLALPVILAGLRTAAVWTVGMATLSTPVGAPSLGNYIFGGLQTRNLDAVLVGCGASAALALLLDGLLQFAGRVSGRRAALGAGGLLLLGAYAAFSALGGRGAGPRPVTIGAKTFTEQYVLAEVLAGQVRRATGRPAEVATSLGSTVVFDALSRGEIDAYVEYSGTIWATLMKRAGAGPGREQVLSEVRDWLHDRHGIEVAARLGFENAYAFALSRAQAERLSLRSLEDLAPHAGRLRAAGDYEFWGRGEWAAVRAAYGIAFGEQRTMDPSLLYTAVAASQVDVITAYSSDGRIAAFDLVTLADPRGAIPPYDALVLVGRRLAAERPDVVQALGRLRGTIDVTRMRALNRQVDDAGHSPSQVAREFLARIP